MQGKTYARVFRAHQNAKSRFIVVGLQAEMTAEARAEYKRLYPRRKTFNGSKLPAEFTAALKAKYVSLSRRLYAHKERQGEKLAAILDHMAAHADMTPFGVTSVVATADSSNWGSQGLGANKYAEASLAWERDVLLQAGFAAEIRQEFGELSCRRLRLWLHVVHLYARSQRRRLATRRPQASVNGAGMAPRS